MIRPLIITGLLFTQLSSAAPAPRAYAPCDSEATEETIALFQRLQEIRGKKILFGHHATSTFMLTRPPEGEARWSDVKAATGEWPALWGFDVQFAVKYNQASKVREDIRFARRLGAAVTLSWHMDNPVTGGTRKDANIDISSILHGGEHHDKLVQQFSAAADFFETLTDENGHPIPVLFRPWHEFNLSDSFWWNKATPDQVRQLWQVTVDYFCKTRGLHNLLFVYCPNYRRSMAIAPDSQSSYMEAYPGDEYVDVLSLDCYGDLRREGVMNILRSLVVEADRRGKIPALTETGVGLGQGYGKPDAPSDWFNVSLLETLKQDPQTRRLAYVMTWYNKPGQYWVPYRTDVNGYAAFMEFFQDDWTAFSGDLPGLKLYKPLEDAQESE